jgi:superfamily II DNA or RNA helicase
VLVDGLAQAGDLGEKFGVLWDPRVGAHRAPARVFYGLAGELRRKGVLGSDGRPLPKLAPPSGLRSPELRPYQEAALAAWRLGGRRGVVVLPTGSGKTRVAIAAIAATRTPALCLVPTRALLAQWSAVLGEHGCAPVGCLGDGERQVGSITVATFASAFRNMARLGDHFGLLVVDEVHHFGGGLFDDALEMSIAPVRLGLTATLPPPGPRRERLAVLVGPTVFELGIGDLAGDHLAPFHRLVMRMRLDPDERREYEALTAIYRRAARAFSGNHLDATWSDFLREAARTDQGRIGIAAWRRASRLLAYPRCKQRALALLLGRHRGQKTLVFVANNETAYAVAREHLIMPLTCDIGRTERLDVLERFRAGTLRALVSAQVLNEGLDVPDAEVGIIVAGRMGEREHVQRVGRLLRPAQGKRALVYELVIERSSEVLQAQRRAEGLVTRRRFAA